MLEFRPVFRILIWVGIVVCAVPECAMLYYVLSGLIETPGGTQYVEHSAKLRRMSGSDWMIILPFVIFQCLLIGGAMYLRRVQKSAGQPLRSAGIPSKAERVI